jgi:hypothetical protein
MSFRIKGLDPAPFASFYGLVEEQLALRGVQRHIVDAEYAYPDRIELKDAVPGETVLLLNYVHQPAPTPFRAAHAIYVREHATLAYDHIGEVPDVLRRRLLSLRAFDAEGMMLDADVVDGSEIERCIARLFSDHAVAYLHAHFAKRGCYAALIERAR